MPKVVQLKRTGVGDKPVIGGGVIPDDDILP